MLFILIIISRGGGRKNRSLREQGPGGVRDAGEEKGERWEFQKGRKQEKFM